MKTLLNRLEKIEQQLEYKAYPPVLFFDDTESYEAYEHKIHPKTIVFINDYGDEDIV